MPVTLKYHQPGGTSGDRSPIDRAICEIVSGKHIDIACPYLSLPYLEQIRKQSSSWRLLTDVEQWIISQAKNSRSEIYDFITEHSERIHYYPGLHAKVIIAEEKALVGSANFTQEGITRRSEMCVLLGDLKQVSELSTWFNRLWELSAPVDVDELAEFIRRAPSYRGDREVPFSLTSPAPKVAARAVVGRDAKRKQVIKHSGEIHDALVDRISLAPSRKWIAEYLNLIKELIEFCELEWDDPRLALTLPKKEHRLPVNINQRYVLNAAFVSEKEAVVGFILGGDFVRYHRLQRQSKRYDPRRGEPTKELPYWWGKYAETPNAALSGEFKQEWINAVRAELRRGKRSGFRKHHESRIYDAAVDLDYRASL